MANAQLCPIGNTINTSLAGCYLYSYAAGTNTSQATYISNSGASGSANPNPIPLNAEGCYGTGIWLSGYYKIIIKDPTNSTVLLTLDNVSGGEATVTPSSGGGGTTSALLNPSANRLMNTNFIYSNLLQADGTSLGSLSNGTQAANRWYVLTQSNPVTGNILNSTGDPVSPTALRITQSNTTSQSFGVIQALTGVVLEPMLGNTVQASIKIRASIPSIWYIAIISQTNTTTDSPTISIVNNWTNPTLTAGNFFITGSDPQGSAVSSSLASNVWTTLSTSLLIPQNTTNLLIFAWSSTAQLLSSTGDFDCAMAYESSGALTYRPVNSSTMLEQATFSNNVIPKQSLLYNSDFKLFQRVNPGASAALANNTYGADRWKVLTQSNTITVNRSLSNILPGATGYNCIQLTQSNATPQRMGMIQFLPATDSLPLRGQQLYINIKAASSVAVNINVALLEWTSTVDSPTTNVVNNWTSTSYTAGGFFIASGITVLGTNSVTVGGSAWTQVPISGISADTNLNNLAVMIWTSTAVAQNAIMYVTDALACIDNHPEVVKIYQPRTLAEDLTNCQAFYEKTYNIDTVPGSITSTGAISSYFVAGSTTGGATVFTYSVPKYKTPSTTPYSVGTGSSGNGWAPAVSSDYTAGIFYAATPGLKSISYTNASAFGTALAVQQHVTSDCDF